MVKETILAVQEAEAQASGLVSEARQKGKELAEQTRREAQSRSEAAEREIRESLEAGRDSFRGRERSRGRDFPDAKARGGEIRGSSTFDYRHPA